MTKIKICGLRRVEDVYAANRALPDFAGFVFAPSPRQVDLQTAAELRGKLDRAVEAVGVFVNQAPGFIGELLERRVIDLVQLHGEEDEDYIFNLKSRWGCRVIKSVGISNSLPKLPQGPDYLLFDTAAKQRGGTGIAFDWRLLEEYRGAGAFFLAGGLHAGNAEAAVRALSPFCVDVSSGIETNGVKDPKKIMEFVHLIRRIS